MMEKLKFTLFAIVTLALLGLFGYWAVSTIQSGTEYVTKQKVETLEKENAELKAEIEQQKNEISSLESKLPSTSPVVNTDPTPKPDPTPTTKPTTYKNQSLINELQTLVNKKVYLKLKSTGSSVGTVQKFLNVYNKTSNKVDNDYGASTKTAVAAFQKDMGLTADGEAGPGTFSKMIDWLKKQG